MILAQHIVMAQQMVGKGVGGALVVGAVIVWLSGSAGGRGR